MRAPVLLLLLALPACAGSPDVLHDADSGELTAQATVLESPEHGPELCLGAVAESYPPQCGGVPLVGWDWAAVAGEESANGTTWGDYRVVGTYDGQTLTVTEAGPPEAVPTESRPIEAGCDDPVDGTGRGSLDETITAARTHPEFAGAWVDGPVLTLAFTGDAAEHERRVGAQWGGPLCVVEHERTHAELEQLQASVQGPHVLWSAVDEVRNRVELGVVRLTPEQREELRRHGEALHVDEALRPAE